MRTLVNVRVVPDPVGGVMAGGDELTLTNKVKRAAVHEKYADQVDTLYVSDRTRRP